MQRNPNLPKLPDGDYGPKLRALTTGRQQRFVLALMDQTRRNYVQAYEIAGYSVESRNSACVMSHRLAHDERIQAALQEEAGRRLKALLPMAVNVMEDILGNPLAKEADRTKIAFGILDRSGLAAAVEHKVTVGLAGDTEMLARIKMLAERNNIPLEQLLGANMAKMIDVTPAIEEKNLENEEY